MKYVFCWAWQLDLLGVGLLQHGKIKIMTIIKLIKHEALNGQVWYRVYVNDSCDESFSDPVKANEYYNKIVQRKNEGFPKSEMILKAEIPDIYELIEQK